MHHEDILLIVCIVPLLLMMLEMFNNWTCLCFYSTLSNVGLVVSQVLYNVC